MRYLQYKGVVEREYKMSLKKIMYQLCIIENRSAVDGAKKLGVAKEIFVYWRYYFRLENRQILFDQTIEDLAGLQSMYADDVKARREKGKIEDSPTDSLEEFEDVLEGLIEYYKYIHYTSEGLSLKTAKLPLYAFSKSVIADYKDGQLQKELNAEG